jgi:DNA-binding NarL/FixJ family response regulator
MLETVGITVIGTASSLATALSAARTSRPDFALVDVDLGGESGFDVVEALQAEPLTPPLVTILISTHDLEDFVELVEMSSAVAFLPKFRLSGELIVSTLAQIA